MEKILNMEFTLKLLEDIINIPSTTGFCKKAIDFIENAVKDYDVNFYRTKKGNGIIEIEGENKNYCVGIPVHVDTLGLMVRSINNDGTIRITSIGGNLFPTLDGEYCKIYTRDNKVYTGTVLSTSPAAHVFNDAKDKPRDELNMIVRLDEVVYNKKSVEDLNICTGDYVCIDPKFEITESGFIKSRYLDNKAGTVCAISLIEIFKRLNKKPRCNIKIIISTYEEVGHGCSYIPEGIDELLGVDMGCVGLDLACTEEQVSICAKDSSGPYDYDITTELINIAKENKLNYAVDIYPSYSSDVSAALRAGNDIRGSIIGPGVQASHGMERTHKKGIENTIKLLYKYLSNN